MAQQQNSQPTDNKQLVGLIMGRYKKAKELRQQYDARWNELDRFYRGEQYFWEKLPPWIPKPVTNFIHLVVTTKRAAISTENQTGMLSAVSREDVAKVEQLQQIYEWLWKKLKVRKYVREAIETSKVLGTAITHVYWDEQTGVMGGTGAYYEGEIRLRNIDPSCFFPDPYATCLDECQYIHVVERKPKKWVEKTFGVSLKDIQGEDRSADTQIYDRPQIYGFADEDTQMVDLHCHYEKYWNTEKAKVIQPVYDDQGNVVDQKETEEEVGGWRYRCTYLVGDKVLKRIDPLVPNRYPFAILYDFKQRNEFWGISHAWLILDNQKLINKVESIIAMIGTLLQNPQKVIHKQSGINPKEAMKYSTAPGHTWVSNIHPKDAIAWQDPPQIPQALFSMAEAAKQNIREITGMNEAYLGQSVGSLQTSSGVNSLIDRATLRDRDQMYDVDLYIEDLSRLILAFMAHYYTEQRYVKVIKDPSKPNDAEFVPFIGTDFQDLEYDFYIDVSSKAPVTQMRKQQEAQDRLQLQGQYGFNPRLITPQEYIQAMDMVGKREIIDRMNKEEMFSNLQKLQTVLQSSLEALSGGVPMQEVLNMAQQHLSQLESGQAPVNPFNPGNIPPGGVPANGIPQAQGGIGSAADNVGQIQRQQAAMPAPPAPAQGF